MCNGKNEKNPGRCNGKCSDLAHRSAYQRIRKLFKKSQEETHASPPEPVLAAPVAGDIDTRARLTELTALVQAVVKGRSVLPDGATPWEVIEHEKLENIQADLYFEHGSLPNALVHLLDETGSLIALRAEELAGKTLADIQQDAAQRVAEAKKAWVDHYRIHKNSEATPAEEALRLRYNAVSNGTDADTLNDMRLLADSYKAALAEQRPMGGTLKLDPDSDPIAAAAVQEGAAFFPTEWTELSNAGRIIYADTDADGVSRYRVRGNAPLREQQQDAMHFPHGSKPEATAHGEWTATGDKTAGGLEVFTRAKWEVAPDGFKVPNGGEDAHLRWEEWVHPVTGAVSVRRPVMAPASITRDASNIVVGSGQQPGAAGLSHYTASAIHEQAHRYEDMQPNILKMENSFLTFRTTLADGSREELQDIGIEGFPANVRPDHFASSYTGRDPYANGFTEVLSTGVQGLFGGHYGGHVGLAGYGEDLGMRNFILGVMATA